MIPANANHITETAVVYAYSSFFYFGPYLTIARLDGTSYQWSYVDNLNEERSCHNVILLNGHFLVVGGRFTKKTEKCTYKNDQMVCHSQSPTLSAYHSTPELLAVSDDYCN